MKLPDEGEDRRLWLSEVGYECVAVRHPSLKHWCGYVALPDGHRMHGMHYDHIKLGEDDYPDVHGGLTFAADHQPNDKPDGRWWIGFDCAHAGDLCPGMIGLTKSYPIAGDVYRDIDYVVAECEKLARQMAAQ